MSSNIDNRNNFFRLPIDIEKKIPDEYKNISYVDLFKYYILNPTYTNIKSHNDIFNKCREIFIEHLLTNSLPYEFMIDPFYNNLYNDIQKKFSEIDIDINSNEFYVEKKAGRCHNYDFEIIYRGKIYKFEYKFRISSLKDSPQFLSLGNISKYINNDFEYYFYCIFLLHIFMQYNKMFGSDLKLPRYEQYEKSVKVSNHKIDDLKKIKEKYSSDKEFNSYCRYISKVAIAKFLENSNINIDILYDKINKTQNNKILLLHSQEIFIEKIELEKLLPTKYCSNKNNNTYVFDTSNEYQIYCLLRWKNGDSISYPALQISLKKTKKTTN